MCTLCVCLSVCLSVSLYVLWLCACVHACVCVCVRVCVYMNFVCYIFRCAGLIAAVANNGVCGVGVAHGARVSGEQH